MLSMSVLILASSSIERANILKEFGYEFVVVKPNSEEKIDESISCEENVINIARQKALIVASSYPNVRILAADTVVSNSDGELLLKPKSQTQAAEFLRKRSNSYEKVITGYCIIKDQDIVKLGTETSVVHYNEIPLKIQQETLDYNEWQGVSGGLRIEGRIAPYIKQIIGDTYNIRGLPIYTLQQFL